MNLFVRMFCVCVASLFKPRLPAGRTQSKLTLLILPNDLDINLHVNNGRYLTFCDLNRVDLFIRTGLASLMIKNRWMPMIAEHTMTYKKPLKLFERVEMTMSLTHWDDKFFYMSHVFVRGDDLVAEGTSKGAVRARSGRIQPADVIRALETKQ